MNLESTVRYVVGVLQSCKSEAQLDNTIQWGVIAIIKAVADKGVPKADHTGKRLTKIIAPRITSCKLCGGTGYINSDLCHQCNGSGRVIVASEITTFVKPYKPQVNQ